MEADDRVYFFGGGPYDGQTKRLPQYPNGYLLKVVVPPIDPIPVLTVGTLPVPDTVNAFRVGHYEIVWSVGRAYRWGIWRGIQN